jgi:para-nitrobenzyl esterase
MMRTPTVRFVKKRAGLGGAPVYNYLFSYNFPIDDGRPAWHCSDIAFFFHNLDTVVVGNKAGVSDRLEEQMSSSFANFAKYGDPNSGSLPRWAPSSEQIVRTMIFDAECRVGENYDDKLYEVCQKHLVNPFLKPKKEDDITLH